MAITTSPRSVSDATRFTPTTPHASSKPSPPPATTSRSRFSPSHSQPVPPSGGGSSRVAGETPEQRVARLRAAHLAAKNAKVSVFDRWVVASRSFFDTAHKMTVMGLIGITVITGLVTVYTAVDMYTYNRKRKLEWIEAQKKLEADELAAARLAYMTNRATEEQIALVEEVNARAAASGGEFKLPSLLGVPKPIQPAPTPLTASSQSGRESGTEANPPTNSSIIAAQARDAFNSEKANQKQGGALDRVGLEETPHTEVRQPRREGWFW